MTSMDFDAAKMLEEAIAKHRVDLGVLVADTSLWAHPETVRLLVSMQGNPCFFPKTRRYRAGRGEKAGETVNGIYLDKNNYPNHAIKQALGIGREANGFEACHIWPNSCYDEACHTAIPNLVLIPRSLAGLSDYSRDIQAALQYRSFELYGWLPRGASTPARPSRYPGSWRQPMAFTDRVRRSIERRRSKHVASGEGD